MSVTAEEIGMEFTNAVLPSLEKAHAIVFDGCHKIYISMNADETDTFRSYEYGVGDDESKLIEIDGKPLAALDQVIQWFFQETCPLRFVEAVDNSAERGNAAFTHLIEQGWENQFYDEEEEDS